MSYTHHVGAGFSFSSRESRINVTKPMSSLVVNTPLDKYSGTLVLADNLASRVQGSPITFSDGVLESGTERAFFSGVYDPTSTDIIKLQGGHRLQCSPGTILPVVAISGINNSIEGTPLFSSSVSLADVNTSVGLALQTKLNKSFVLNGGTVKLNDNLALADGVSIGASIVDDYGSIIFNGKTMTLPGTDSVWTGTLLLNNPSSLSLAANVKLMGTWIFGPENGKSVVNGNGNVLDLSATGTLWIKSNHTVSINNAVIKGLGGQGGGWILLEDTNSTLSLSGCTLQLAQNYNFTQGVLYFYGQDTTFVTGDKIFQAALNGKMVIDGVALGYNPLSTPDVNNIRPSNPDNINLTVINSGILRNTTGSVTDIFLDLATNSLVRNESIAPNHVIFFRGASTLSSTITLNGGGFSLNFARVNSPLLFVLDNKTAYLSNIVLKDFSPAHISLGSNSALHFGDAVTIELSKPEDLSSTWSFVGGTSSIVGHGSTLNLSGPLALAVYADTKLQINNTHLTGLAGNSFTIPGGSGISQVEYRASTNNMRCLSMSSTLELRDTSMLLGDNFTFTAGNINIFGRVSMSGADRTFAWKSPGNLTINSDSRLVLDRDLTFSYDSVDRTTKHKDHLVLKDSSSQLHLMGCTLHSTWTGVNLRWGTMLVQDRVLLESEGRNSSEAILIDDNLTVQLLSGANLEVSGQMVYAAL